MDCRRRIWTSPGRNYIPGIRNLRNGKLRWTGFCAHGTTASGRSIIGTCSKRTLWREFRRKHHENGTVCDLCVCTFPCLRLRLKERPLYEFKAVDLGNVCHRALELFSKKASEAGGWTVLPEEERKKLIDASVEEAITDYGNSVLYSTARNEQMIVRMKQMLERTVWHLRTS